MKNCSICKVDKDLSCFHKQKNSPDGIGYVCKVCKKDALKKKTDTLKGRLQFLLYNSKSSARIREYEWGISIEYLEQLYEAQDGKCALTGEVLSLHRQRRGRTTISIDRIDNSKGYVEGNIQLITFQANIAKSNYSMDELIEFCRKVVEHASKL